MVADTSHVEWPDKYEPGCCDVATGIVIEDSIYDAYDKTPLRTTLSEDLWRRYHMIDQAVAEMEHGEGLETWWDKIPGLESQRNSSRPMNLTLSRHGGSAGLLVSSK